MQEQYDEILAVGMGGFDQNGHMLSAVMYWISCAVDSKNELSSVHVPHKFKCIFVEILRLVSPPFSNFYFMGFFFSYLGQNFLNPFPYIQTSFMDGRQGRTYLLDSQRNVKLFDVCVVWIK